jgi:hypothetical protein
VTSPTQFAFLTVSGIIVLASLLFWIPFRSGRSPLAIYDLGSSISVSGTLAVMSVGFAGLPLWLGGAGGLAGGLAAALLIHRFRHRLTLSSEPKLALFYVFAFIFLAACTVAGTLGVRWALKA